MLIFQTPPNLGSETILTQLSGFLESARGVLEITPRMGQLQSKCMDLKESAASVFFFCPWLSTNQRLRVFFG
jgi:hypothetical protein